MSECKRHFPQISDMASIQSSGTCWAFSFQSSGSNRVTHLGPSYSLLHYTQWSTAETQHAICSYLVSYLDDGVFSGKRSEIEEALEIPEIIEKKYHELLGAPIDSLQFCQNAIAEKAKEANELLSKLRELGNPPPPHCSYLRFILQF